VGLGTRLQALMNDEVVVPLWSVDRQAEVLVDLLVDHGPLTSAQVCVKLDWTKGRFDSALREARENLCPALSLTIPHPTPRDGWRYQVTADWEPVEAGASYSLGAIETRLKSLSRDVTVVLPHLERGSVEWRRANFLHKHLRHIVSTLREINDGEG
jgi:hypothetical protein